MLVCLDFPFRLYCMEFTLPPGLHPSRARHVVSLHLCACGRRASPFPSEKGLLLTQTPRFRKGTLRCLSRLFPKAHCGDKPSPYCIINTDTPNDVCNGPPCAVMTTRFSAPRSRLSHRSSRTSTRRAFAARRIRPFPACRNAGLWQPDTVDGMPSSTPARCRGRGRCRS